MASPPEPTEAMVEAAAVALSRYGNERDWQKMRPDEMAGLALRAAFAVSPGCRGAELTEAVEAIQRYAENTQLGDLNEYEALNEVARLCREALAAFGASGEAGPDPERSNT